MTSRAVLLSCLASLACSGSEPPSGASEDPPGTSEARSEELYSLTLITRGILTGGEVVVEGDRAEGVLHLGVDILSGGSFRDGAPAGAGFPLSFSEPRVELSGSQVPSRIHAAPGRAPLVPNEELAPVVIRFDIRDASALASLRNACGRQVFLDAGAAWSLGELETSRPLAIGPEVTTSGTLSTEDGFLPVRCN